MGSEHNSSLWAGGSGKKPGEMPLSVHVKNTAELAQAGRKEFGDRALFHSWGVGSEAGAGGVTGLEAEGLDDGFAFAPGAVVIAVSGFSRWSWLGPRPSLISALESGTDLDCHP